MHEHVIQIFAFCLCYKVNLQNIITYQMAEYDF